MTNQEIEAKYDEYHKFDLIEGEELIVNGEECTFWDYDECHGMIFVQFPNAPRPRAVSIEIVTRKNQPDSRV